MWESLQVVVLGNYVYAWMLALVVGAFSLAALIAIRSWSIRSLAILAKRTTTAVDDMLANVLARTHPAFLIMLAVRAAVAVLHVGPTVASGLRVVTVLAVVLQGGLWADATARFWSSRLLRDDSRADSSRVALVGVLGVVGRIGVWTLVVLLGLQNLGVEVTALLAGLGVGGIAIALALQNVLGDVFASLSIALDRPFVAGDFIVVGDFMGAVEHVGLKTTRVRSLGGELLVFSNADLLASRIRNFGRMAERRVLFTLGIRYETPGDVVARVPSMLRDVVQSVGPTRFDRAHFKAYGDFALVYEVVYYVLSPDYNLFMDLQQEINLKIFEQFDKEGVEFAYPTQTLLVRDTRAATPS